MVIDQQVKWTNEAVLLLLSIKVEKESLFSSTICTQKQAWRKVAEEMCTKGEHCTGEDCDRKFRSLKMRLAKCTESLYKKLVPTIGNLALYSVWSARLFFCSKKLNCIAIS